MFVIQLVVNFFLGFHNLARCTLPESKWDCNTETQTSPTTGHNIPSQLLVGTLRSCPKIFINRREISRCKLGLVLNSFLVQFLGGFTQRQRAIVLLSNLRRQSHILNNTNQLESKI